MSMNRELVVLYTKLSDEAKQRINYSLQASPKLHQLLSILNSDKDIQTTAAVKKLYPEEMNKVSLTTLRNRYFKLRKKLLDTIKDSESDAVEQHKPALQVELEVARNTIYAGELAAGIRLLERLAAKLQELNIFELMPETYRLLTYAHQAQLDLAKAEQTLKAQEKSAKLLADLHETQRLSAKALLDYKQGFQQVKQTLGKIKTIANRHTDRPRFKLIYLAANMVHGSASLANDPRALARYFNSYSKLKEQHPNIPVNAYETNYIYLDQFRYLTSRAYFEYLKQDMNALYRSTTEYWKLMKQVPQLHHKYSEPLFFNKIRTELALNKYQEAFRTLEELKLFQKRNENSHHSPTTIIEEARIYFYAMPVLYPDNIPAFVDRLGRAVKQLDKNTNLMPIGDTLGILAMWQFFAGRYKEAVKTIYQKACQEYLGAIDLLVINQVLELPLQKPTELKIKNLKAEIQQQKRDHKYAHASRFLDRLVFMLDQIKILK